MVMLPSAHFGSEWLTAGLPHPMVGCNMSFGLVVQTHFINFVPVLRSLWPNKGVGEYCVFFKPYCSSKTMDLIKVAQDAFKSGVELPSFKSGDTVSVSYKIKEGSKERIQVFKGVVIQIKGEGVGKRFTVRKISNGIGVERIFPMNSPFIDKVVVDRIGKVRRARLYYLRGLTGKKARIKEKRR